MKGDEKFMARSEFLSTENPTQNLHLDTSVIAAEKAEKLRSSMYTIASDMPKQSCPSLAVQMFESIAKIVELLYIANDPYNNEHSSSSRQVLRRNARAEIKMLSLLTQLAFERRAITIEQFEEISQKTAECKQILFQGIFN